MTGNVERKLYRDNIAIYASKQKYSKYPNHGLDTPFNGRILISRYELFHPYTTSLRRWVTITDHPDDFFHLTQVPIDYTSLINFIAQIGLKPASSTNHFNIEANFKWTWDNFKRPTLEIVGVQS